MKSTSLSKKRRIGRPPVDTEALTVRMAVAVLKEIDNWRRRQEDLPGRPEAVRRLVEQALRENSARRAI
jgi:metal-responsive CopG/Arc/MetJ family transcriptional regulator